MSMTIQEALRRPANTSPYTMAYRSATTRIRKAISGVMHDGQGKTLHLPRRYTTFIQFTA